MPKLLRNPLIPAVQIFAATSNYFPEGELEAAMAALIDHYNHRRYHESIGNLTPADIYFGRGETILAERRPIKQQSIRNRLLNH